MNADDRLGTQYAHWDREKAVESLIGLEQIFGWPWISERRLQ